MLDLQAYLNGLASAQPVPGGGSAATLVGALGAALVAMVARLTLGNARYAAVHAEATLLVGEADVLRARFLGARTADEAAFAAVVAAQALPRSDAAAQAHRRAELQAALAGAAAAPLDAAALAAELLAACRRAAGLGNTGLMSDVACAVEFGRASFAASVANVRVNHRYLADERLVAEQRHRLDVLAAQTSEDEHAARARIDEAG